MKKQRGSQSGSGENPENPGKPLPAESKPQKTTPAKSKVQPIRGPSKNGQPASQTTPPEKKSLVSESGSLSPSKKAVARRTVPRLEEKRARQAEAVKRLKVNSAKLAKCPPITSFIRANVKGGLRAALRAMRFIQDDPDISSFLDKYDSIPESDQEKIPWEAIVVTAEIDAQHLVGAIMFAVQTTAYNAARFIATSHYPQIMKAAADSAKLPSGDRDRAAFHQMMGFTPSPKGPTFIGKAIFGMNTGAKEQGDSEVPQAKPMAMEDDINALFPSATTTQNKLIPIRQRQLQSPSDAE